VSQTPRARPVAEGLFQWPSDTPHLIAGRDPQTGRLVFPVPAGPQDARLTPHPLQTEGSLWSWTIQRFPPKDWLGETDPRAFTPYGVGYVELPGELIVETRLSTATDLTALKVGQPMRLVIEPFATDPDGTAVLTYAFEAA
jgi:uncharacterized protein